VLDQVRQVLRLRHYSPRTEESYVNWARRFFRFHQLRHPRTMGTAEVEQFLTHLAVEGNISASSQNQALNALVFLYAHVLEMPLERIDAVRARRGKRLPVVLTPEEVAAVLNRVSGVPSPLDLLGSVSDEIDTTADVSRPSSLIPAASSG
jgi:site-specific recombinase XerD